MEAFLRILMGGAASFVCPPSPAGLSSASLVAGGSMTSADALYGRAITSVYFSSSFTSSQVLHLLPGGGLYLSGAGLRANSRLVVAVCKQCCIPGNLCLPTQSEKVLTQTSPHLLSPHKNNTQDKMAEDH